MTFWTYQNIADVTQGQWLVEPNDLGDVVAGLWHDTREIQPGQAYLAIKGENFDGHDFIDKAFDAGAALAIVSDPSLKPTPSSPTLCVNDTVKALQDLARAYRDELKAGGCKVIGIAGSNGKTTTRHLIHHVLTYAGLKGTQSPKSFNNHLGVPLTLLSAKPSDAFVACEIGTNHPGEIDFLSAIARPDIAVITSIGEEHLEFFGDLDGVADEEFSIVNHIAKDGFIVGGLYDYDARLEKLVNGRFRWIKTYEGSCDPPWEMPLLGEHNRNNAAATIVVACILGVDDATSGDALMKVRPAPHRGELIQLGEDVTLYDDCYNANPASVREALGVLDEIADGQGVFVFGDMYELGDMGPAAHRAIGEHARSISLRRFITIGQLASQAAGDVQFDDWSETLPDEIAALIEPGDTVLLKASRGMRLERLIPAIERRFGPATGDEPT